MEGCGERLGLVEADAEGEGLVLEAGEDDGLEDGEGEGEAEGDGEELGLMEGLSVALTAGLTEGFTEGLGEGDGLGLGSSVGLGDGELVCPRTSGFDGKKTDLSQKPRPARIISNMEHKITVNFEGF